jgi:hypothetical protein
VAITAENTVYLSRYPIVIVTCFTFLFYFMGASALSGVAIFGLAFLTNIILTKISARLQEKYMGLKDERLNGITECLNNIKMLKLYSWT